MRCVELGDRKIYYHCPSETAEGNLGSLIYIHGSGGDHHKWDRQIPALPHGYAGVFPDLPGHGASPGPPCVSIKEIAYLLHDCIQKLALSGPLYLVGHSLGAAVCLQFSLDFPGDLDGMVLIGSGPSMKVNPQFLLDLKESRLTPDFFRLGFSSQTSEELIKKELLSSSRVPVPILYADFNACNDFDIGQDAAKINTPTLLIVGEQDRLTPVKHSQKLHQDIVGSNLLIVPAAGHFAMTEQEDIINEAIRDFVNKTHQ